MADQISLRRETNLYDDETIKAVNNKVTSQYAVSTTSSSTVAKTATVDGVFTLFKNARVSVFFQNANTSTSPTLNVAGTGAKPIWAYGGPLSATGNTFNWVANSTIEFVYDGEHWLVADSGAVGLISKYDEKLSQEVVFNKLTNNGAIRGIFMKDGQMYINMDYLQTGTLKLGGVNNGNGIMTVYDASGTEIGRWDNNGIYAKVSDYTLSMKTVTYNDGVFTRYVTGLAMEYDGNNSKMINIVSPNKITSVYYKLPSNSSFNSPSGYAIRKADFSQVTVGTPGYIEETVGTYGYKLIYALKLTSSSWTPAGEFRVGNKLFCYNYDPVYRNYSDPSFALIDGWFRAQITSQAYLLGSSAYWYIKSSNQSGNIAVQGSSSKRYKHDITDQIDEELDAYRLYNLPMKQFVFNDDFEKWQYGDLKGKTLPGFIAEDVAKIYPAAVIHDEDGNIESWDERRIIPGMLALIQEQKKQLDEQAERIKKLENNTSFIHIM